MCSPIPALFLLLADLRTRLDGGAFGLEPRFPHRARLSDPASLPHDRPAVEPGPGHGDGVEPQPVADGFAPFEVDWGHALAARQLSIKRELNKNGIT